MKTKINDCSIIELGKLNCQSINYPILDNKLNIPFIVKRIYYLFEIPKGETRGGHAHKALFQIIVAANGSFDIILDDGETKKIVSLNDPNIGLLIVPGIWRELINFSKDSVCLVFASEVYSEDDYIRDYDIFLKYKINE